MVEVFCSRSLVTKLIHQPDELAGVYNLGLGMFEVYTQGRVALSPGVDLFKPVGLRTMNVYDTLIYHIVCIEKRQLGYGRYVISDEIEGGTRCQKFRRAKDCTFLNLDRNRLPH